MVFLCFIVLRTLQVSVVTQSMSQFTADEFSSLGSRWDLSFSSKPNWCRMNQQTYAKNTVMRWSVANNFYQKDVTTDSMPNSRRYSFGGYNGVDGWPLLDQRCQIPTYWKRRFSTFHSGRTCWKVKIGVSYSWRHLLFYKTKTFIILIFLKRSKCL